ncbi:hypothetical protein [Neorhodopirellula pilleata]|nr:hypothetical protein [Neorhodopirellula pilleata]
MSTSEIKAAIPPALVILGDEAELETAGVAADSWSAGEAMGSEAIGGEAALGLGSSLGAAAVRGSDSMGMISDFEDHDETFDQSQLDTVAEIEPINLASDEFSADDSDEESMELEEMELISGESSEIDEESDLDEYEIPNQSDDTEPSPSVAPVMMDIEATRRRRSGGPAWKSIVGVALGGLLSLPIVGGLLHVLGKPVPVIGPILNEYIPMGNQSVAKRASAPMAIDPPVLLDNEPVQGRSLADELSPSELNPGGMAPADAALAEITGDSQPTEPSLPDLATETEPMETDAGFPFPETVPGSDPSLPVVEELNADSPDTSSGASPATDLFGAATMRAEESKPATSEPIAVEPIAVEPAAPAFDVAGEVSRLKQSLTAISSMPAGDAGRAKAVNQLYADLSELAGQADGDSIEKARPLMAELNSDMSLVKAFALAAPTWLDRTESQRETNGAVVVGKLSGEPGNASILLSNKQAVSVSLPNGMTEVPGGIQVGLGKIEGSGDTKSIAIELLQGL